MYSKVKFDTDYQMLKVESLNSYAKDFMSERLISSMQKIYEEIQTNGDAIRKEFLGVCDELFKKCILQQQNLKKDKINFMYFFYLRSAMFTKKHEIQLNMYTKDGYMDKTETMKLWYPEFIMNVYEQDMEELDKAAKKKIIHYGYPQYMELRDRCAYLYIMFIRDYIISEMPNMMSLDSYRNMKLDNEFKIVFSEYMDRGIKLWPHTTDT